MVVVDLIFRRENLAIRVWFQTNERAQYADKEFMSEIMKIFETMRNDMKAYHRDHEELKDNIKTFFNRLTLSLDKADKESERWSSFREILTVLVFLLIGLVTRIALSCCELGLWKYCVHAINIYAFLNATTLVVLHFYNFCIRNEIHIVLANAFAAMMDWSYNLFESILATK